MNLAEAHSFTKAYASQIWRRMKLRDPLATSLVLACEAFIRDQQNVDKQQEFMRVADDYSRRNLFLSEHQDLERRYGHDDESPRPSRIVVPDGVQSR